MEKFDLFKYEDEFIAKYGKSEKSIINFPRDVIVDPISIDDAFAQFEVKKYLIPYPLTSSNRDRIAPYNSYLNFVKTKIT